MCLNLSGDKVFFRDQTDYVTTITDMYFSKYQTEHQVNSNKEHQEIGTLKIFVSRC